jgi:CheY-like chemotaxis protein
VSLPARRVLIADATAAGRDALEPPLRRAGWTVVTVVSSGDVLRAVRDHAVQILLIDPALPGAGVSGADVVRTLKAATRYRDLPVLLLLHRNQGVPPGVAADGAVELERLTDAVLLAALERALRPAAAEGGAECDAAVRRAVAQLFDAQVGAAVEAAVREVAREVVPPIAERLIREEIERLRREHGLGA